MAPRTSSALAPRCWLCSAEGLSALRGTAEPGFQSKSAENCIWINGHKSGKKTIHVMVQISHLPYGYNRNIYPWNVWNWQKPSQVLWNNASSFFLSSVSTSFAWFLKPWQKKRQSLGLAPILLWLLTQPLAEAPRVLHGEAVTQPAGVREQLLASRSFPQHLSNPWAPLHRCSSSGCCPQVPLQTQPDTTTCQLSAGTQQAASRGFHSKSLLILFC